MKRNSKKPAKFGGSARNSFQVPSPIPGREKCENCSPHNVQGCSRIALVVNGLGLHPDVQRKALQDLYTEVGFARSLLAYELPDGRLKLLDGHLRRDLDPDMEVDVEVLDVNDAEARALLLSIDPLAALALTQEQLRDCLLELTPVSNANRQTAVEVASRRL